jgi:hypothetical protein
LLLYLLNTVYQQVFEVNVIYLNEVYVYHVSYTFFVWCLFEKTCKVKFDYYYCHHQFEHKVGFVGMVYKTSYYIVLTKHAQHFVIETCWQKDVTLPVMCPFTAMSYVRQLVILFSQHRTVSIPGLSQPIAFSWPISYSCHHTWMMDPQNMCVYIYDHVWFIVDRITMGQVLHKALCFPFLSVIIPPLPHICFHLSTVSAI